MKLLASLAFGLATFVATTFGLAQPAMADDDVTVGVRLGPLCVGLCIGGGDGGGRGHHRYHRSGYDYDNDDGFYSDRADYYHQRYDRRGSYDEARDDGYAGYRRHHSDPYRGGGHRKHHGQTDDDEGGDDDEGED